MQRLRNHHHRSQQYVAVAEARPHLQILVAGLRAIRRDLTAPGTSEAWRIEDLPGSLRRLVIFEDATISIALTHFVGRDLLVHDHRRVFYSACLSGRYTHCLYGLRPRREADAPAVCFETRRATGGRFAAPTPTNEEPVLRMEHDHVRGAVYTMRPEALHRIDLSSSEDDPVVTLLVKVQSPAGAEKAESTFYFADPVRDPALLANAGQLSDLAPDERRGVLSVFRGALDHVLPDDLDPARSGRNRASCFGCLLGGR